MDMLSLNVNRTELSPIRSVFIRVIKLDDREAGVQFVTHEYAYRQNWTTRSPVCNFRKQQMHLGQISLVETV